MNGFGIMNNLYGSDEAQEALRRIDRVTKSDNIFIKKSVKSLFIICPQGAGLTHYAKAYEEIIISNNVYPIHGKNTFLQLAFPRMGKEKDYDAFYVSPQLVAETVNDFAGVFLISFEQWNSFAELNRDSEFEHLCQYIDKHKESISYVFHVLPNFTDADKLAKTLNRCVNLERIELYGPKLTEAEEYVLAKVNKMKGQFSDNAKDKLEELIEKKLCVESQDYYCFESLQRFSDEIVYEIACRCEEDAEGIRRVDLETMCNISDAVDFAVDEGETKPRLGFYA